jgi:hypothetical protein
MINFRFRSACLALILLPLGHASAAYNPGIVAADARWVVHADFNVLRNSTLGKELVTAIGKAQSEATGGVIGLDVPKLLATVGSVTAYGTNLTPDPNAVDGTLIAQGTADLRKIAESILLQGTLAEPEVFSEVKDLPFPAYAVTDPKAPAATRVQVVVAFPPEPIVLVSKSKAQLLKARDVFRGAAPSLAKGGAPALTKLNANAEGAYLFAASIVPAETMFPQNSPQSRILQLASSGSIAFGERGANTFAHAELLASSDANAEKLMKILQGMTAVLSLAESNDKQLAEFLNSTAVTREKETVILHLAYSSERLVQMSHKLRDQVEARPVHRPQIISAGTVVAEWGGDGVTVPVAESATPEPTSRTIENVKLANGGTITLGRAMHGGKHARFTRVEVQPAGGTGSPLVFGPEMMRQERGTMWKLQFPGVEGTYTLKVTYLPDPEGKAKFAVSVRNPNDPQTPPANASGR